MPKTKDIDILSEPFRLLLYGKYRTGKTVLAASFPTPGKVFNLDKDNITYKDSGGDWTISEYYMGESASATWSKLYKDVLAFKKEVFSPDNIWKSCVLDSLTMASQLATAVAIEKFPLAIGEKLDRYIHYPIITSLIAGLFLHLKELPINFVATGHIITGKDDITKLDYVYPLIPGAQLKEILPAMFGEIWYAKPKKVIGNKIKYMFLTDVEGLCEGRSRFSGVKARFPKYVPNNYGKIMTILKKSLGDK